MNNNISNINSQKNMMSSHMNNTNKNFRNDKDNYHLESSHLSKENKDKEILTSNVNYLPKENKDKEILNLKKELNNAKDIIEKQKHIINNLKNQIEDNSNYIQLYQDLINQKEQELKNLKIEFDNIKSKSKVNEDKSKIMTVNITFEDRKKPFPVPCVDTDTFAEVEEKLYKQFPEFRETNNNFIFNGESVLRFKTISQNNIENGSPITIVVPQLKKRKLNH